MKALICGSRKWLAQKPIEAVMRSLPPYTEIIHGAAPGVDSISAFVGALLGFQVRDYPALAHGRKWPWAGPARNQEMLDKEHPSEDGTYIDKAFIFHEEASLGKGTRDMYERLLKAQPPIEIQIFIGRGR